MLLKLTELETQDYQDSEEVIQVDLNQNIFLSMMRSNGVSSFIIFLKLNFMCFLFSSLNLLPYRFKIKFIVNLNTAIFIVF